MAHWLFLPHDAIDDVQTLSKLSKDGLARLRKFLDSSDFRLRYAFFVEIADLLGISDETAAKLCYFINHVQTQRAKHGKSGAAVSEELENFLEGIIKEDTNRRSEAEALLVYVRGHRADLGELFSALSEFDFSTKVRGLETGPLPHLKSFRTYCDIRPVYDAEANAIVSYFPVITLSLVTHTAESDETKEVVVQLVESDIEDLRKQLDRLEKKLVRLKADVSSLPTKKRRVEP